MERIAHLVLLAVEKEGEESARITLNNWSI